MKNQIWKRLLAMVLVVVMSVTLLPTAAYAALLDNTPDQNEKILRELTEFWGDEKTAEEAIKLLRQYGLIDKEGNVLTDWSGTITIEEESRPLTIGEAQELAGGDVTVNGRACTVDQLQDALDNLASLGLLADNTPVADWQLQVDGHAVAPAELSAVLDGWTAQEAPETPEENPENPGEAPKAESGLLQSIAALFTLGSEAPAAPVVTVLGRTADSAAVRKAVDFLTQYGLLTETGCVSDWELTLPGGERKADLTELLRMLESGEYDPNMVITVDQTPITMADFKTMMDIQKEVERIQSTYFPEGGVDWTEEELGSLYDLYLQLQENGIQLYNTQGADHLEFPSQKDQTQTISVPTQVTSSKSKAEITVSLAHIAKQPVSLNWQIIAAGISGTIEGKTQGTVEIPAGSSSKTLTLSVATPTERWNGDQMLFVRFDSPQGAIFQEETGSPYGATTRVLYSQAVDWGIDASGEISILPDPETYGTYKMEGSGGYGIRDVGAIGNLNEAKRIGWMGINHGYDSHWAEGTLKFDIPPQVRQAAEDGILNQLIVESSPGEYTLCEKAWFKVNNELVWKIGPDYRTEHWKYTHDGENCNKVVRDLDIWRGQPLQTYIKPVSGLPRMDYVELTGHLEDHMRDDSHITWHALQSRIILTKVAFQDTAAPAIKAYSIPQNMKFYAGDKVPIALTFTEPVKITQNSTLTVNGESLAPVTTGTLKTAVWLYPIETGSPKTLRITAISDVTDIAGHPASFGKQHTVDTQVVAADLHHALQQPSVDQIHVTELTYYPPEGNQPEKTAATVEITLDIPQDEDLRQLIADSYPLDNGFACAKLAASIDGGETLIPLVFDNGTKPTQMTATAEIDVAKLVGFEGDAKDFIMEFYNITVDTPNANAVTKGDLLFGRYAAFSVKKPVPLTGENLSIETPEEWMTNIYVNDPPEEAKLTLKGEVTGSGYTWSQTRWVSGNPEIATIDPATGAIHPLAKGTVEFWLEAVNGGLEEYQGEDYQSEHISLTIQEGANPYLRIPEQEITLRAGDPLTLRWASNLAQKNNEYGNAATTFTIKVYGGTDSTGTPVKTYDVTYDPSTPDGTITMGDGTTLPMWTTDESGALTPNQSFVIPGLDDTGNGYTITITAQTAEGVPNAPSDRTFTAQTRVTVTAQPVSVSLTRPDALFKVNEGSLKIPYVLEHFDAEGGGADFKLVVTNNSTGEKVLETTNYNQYGDTASGQFTIDLSGAKITDSFRTIYDVTLQAKNTTAGQDWSRDSFTLYIYDKNALDILVQPVERGGITTVGVDGNTVTMSNAEWIASLSQDEILALNRDIDLQTAISINYGDHAWGEASDRIRWAVKNSETAAVNYPQGAYYENIEGLPYSSYGPATQFLLSGKNDGKTVVEAIHDLAGSSLSSSVEVTVETLKDKLYLFQFYPAAKGLTMTYTNGAGEEKTAASDDQGRFAIYEASGIASNVYVQGTAGGELYLGTVYQETLVSQEKDAVSLELYPLNSLELRKAATLPLYLKTPDGKDYEGNTTVRVGVYRNGVYCPEAKYALRSGEEATIPGTKDQEVEFVHGKATLQTGEHNTRSGDFKQEVAYAIIDEPASEDAELLASGTPAEYQVTRYVQMTDDDAMDENPQVAAVKLGDSDEKESFVIGWSSTSGTGVEQENDIKLAAVNADGNRLTGFVDSLSSLIANTGVRVNADFRFSRNANTLNDLSILWKESAVNEESLNNEDGKAPANYDYLSGLRFRMSGSNISVTAAQRIAQMGQWTAIDNFDAYVDGDGKLLSVLQGTYYDYENLNEVLVTEGGSSYTVYLPGEKTSIYLGSGTYTDTLRVDSVIPDYQHIKKGMSIPVQLSVTNLGTQPMNKVEVSIGNSKTSFEAGAEGSSFVAIAPGETRALTLFYTVPADGAIPNPNYTITGTFQSGGSSKSEGTLTLNIPDLGIAGSETLLEAQDGQRVLQFTLYNNSDAELAGSDRTVKFNLYSDPECTQSIPAQYFQEIVTYANDTEALKTIEGDDLAKIDEGYYTVQYRFNLAEYIKQQKDGKTPYADENGEVRDGGINLYAKAWVEVTDDGKTGEMLECIDTNNIVPIHLESLLKQADGEHVTISQGLAKNGSGTTVDVTLNNNSIVDSETGNVVVWLYDANDKVVEVQQSYTTEDDLITLAPEERKMMTFTFDKPGVRAQVSYGDLVLDEDSATLTHLSFSGLSTLADFAQQEDGNYSASVEVSQVSSTTVTAVADDPDAVIKVNGQPLESAGMVLDLSRGENVLTVEVTAGSEKLTYTLTVQNDWPSSGGGGSSGGSSDPSVTYPIETSDWIEHGTVTVKPSSAEKGDTVTITAKPEEGYQVGKVTVTDKNGSTIKVTDKGNGKYTFIMPNSKVSVDVTFVSKGQWTNPFVDVPEGAWYYDGMKFVYENGLMAGTSSNTFSPDVTTTRGMLVTILWRLAGSPNIEDEIWGYPFKDVDANAYYATAVYWARMNGIVAGYSDELFGPNDTITREQMATILYRYAQHKGYDTTAKADLSKYTDAAQIGPWATEAIRWANAEGLVNGTSATTLTPKGSATRAQVAVILTRFCEKVAK